MISMTTLLGLILVIGGIAVVVVIGLIAAWYYRDKE